MRLVEKEDELRFFGIAYLGQLLEQLRQQPKQEGSVQSRIFNQLVGGKHIDEAAAVTVRTQKVGKVERRFAKEGLGALVFQHQQLPLHGAHRRR